ncbi:uncharacterized protein TRUGW13939_06040 [Talaromyces rugulosus]|uniref:MARVEL domain-containing protein n=1 Tax=Talaromyces rugulosus TaxID=121627 RepID=A0A7H8QXV9_TALRU|nr:uncharacterized protein TRUGW13939_06040 [Talaromyces rugulosus]QKX58912.1 hypothetical protein TRUGW13939_06040 [Talaromyces rugulosus]
MQPSIRLRSLWIRTRQRIIRSGNSAWLFKKTVIRCAGAVLALISLACFAAAIEPWNRTFEHTSGPVRGDWQDGISIAPLALAILHNSYTAVYTAYTARKIPCSVELVMDFLIWAALLPGLIFSIWGGTFNVWRGEQGQLAMTLCESGMNAETWSRECFMELYHIGSLELAGIVFAIPLWAMHVFLFAHRITEARSQRRHRRQRPWASIKEIEQGDTEAYPRMPRRPPQSYASPERLASSNPTYYQYRSAFN